MRKIFKGNVLYVKLVLIEKMSGRQLTITDAPAKQKIVVPPIKCQGIKTKIVPHIIDNLKWNGKGRWIEPFLGSGVVLFNVNPQKALVNDINLHIIEFYKNLQSRKITPNLVRDFLIKEGSRLKDVGADHYYKIRERFNRHKNPLDILFLNRSCFNGVMRFNGKGKFNVPFCRKPERFRQSYITKIINQVRNVQSIMNGKDWQFQSKDWKEILNKAESNDFVYLDPPYVGRHTGYYNKWVEKDAIKMAAVCKNLPCPFMVSMWKRNKYRENEHLKKEWKGFKMVSIEHFYHVGSTEDLRNKMEEVLILGNIN